MYFEQNLNFNRSAYEFLAENNTSALFVKYSNPFETIVRKLLTAVMPAKKEICGCESCLREIVKSTLQYLPELPANTPVESTRNDNNDLTMKAVEKALSAVKDSSSDFCIKLSPLSNFSIDKIEWAA
jgi:hypothetical protein